MSDSKLRDLERRWRETKSVEDGAAYLRERVRLADLTQERLELAAWLGDDAAQAAIGRDATTVGLRSWVQGLAPGGRETLVRAFVAIARMFPPRTESGAACLAAAEAWCLEPTSARANDAHDAAIEDSYGLSGARYLGGIAQPENLAYHCANHAALMAADRHLSERPPEAEVSASAVAAARATSELAVRQAITRAFSGIGAMGLGSG